MSDLPKTFEPAAIEQQWYEHWEREGLFRPDRPDAQPWTIVMASTPQSTIGTAPECHQYGRSTIGGL